jgi:outer membrane cobalamin receptor
VAIDGQALRDSPRGDVLAAISQRTAGVYVSSRGVLHGVSSGSTGSIHVRGLGGSPNSQVLVVEDGVPDYQGIFGHPIPDAYIPALIDEALVVLGGDSVLYGTNALGGAIVIRSRWRELDGYELQNDAAYGSFSTLSETASALGRFEKWDVAAAFHALTTDGHRDGAGGNEAIGITAARYRFDEDLSLTLRNKVVHLEGGDPGPATHPYTFHWYDVWRDNASLRLGYDRGGARVSFTPYLNVGAHELYDGFESTDWVGGGIADIELALEKIAILAFGLAVESAGGEIENRISGERPDVRGVADAAFYDQITIKPVERLSLVLGSRELYSTTYGFVFLYKGGARVELPAGLYAESRVSKNFREPTIRELYLPYPVANPDLEPESSLTWDASAGHDSKHLGVELTVYRTEADDMIKYFGVWPSAEVVNIDHIVIWGVEGELRVSEIGPLGFLVSGDFQRVGRYTRQNPNAKLDFQIDLGRDFGPHFAGAQLTGEWVHGLFMADYSRQPMEDAFSMDLSLRYRYTASRDGFTVEPYVFLKNLLDRRYAYVADYPMPGFNLMAGLKIGI